ncbi:hypothetical protein V6N13_007962 [Hibiscus sabdariffa]
MFQVSQSNISIKNQVLVVLLSSQSLETFWNIGSSSFNSTELAALVAIKVANSRSTSPESPSGHNHVKKQILTCRLWFCRRWREWVPCEGIFGKGKRLKFEAIGFKVKAVAFPLLNEEHFKWEEYMQDIQIGLIV